MAGKTRVSVKTGKLCGKAIVLDGAETAARTLGLLGGILSYAVETGITEGNPARGIASQRTMSASAGFVRKSIVRSGQTLQEATQDKYTLTVDIIRQIALKPTRLFRV
jgi:hypothetical protein